MKKITVILYSIFLLLFFIFSYTFVDANLSYLKNLYTDFAFSNRLLVTILYSFSIVIFFVLYGIFIYLGMKKRITLREIMVLIGITTTILVFSYPAMLSYDIFNYIATSKVLFFYRENPYVVMPIEFVGDPLLGFTHAANKIALYGPAWLILSGIPYALGQDNFLITLFNFKFLTAVFYLATTFLIWKISKNMLPVVLFALNPLIIIETLVSGHNDIVMIFLVLLSLFLLSKKKIFLGTLFFVLSIFIKYTTVLLIPVLLFMVWKIIRKKEVNVGNIFYLSSLLMYIAFFLSPIREEIYPWYAIWFLSFSFLVPNKKIILYISLAFSFGLLFRYVPFMLTGTHADLTPNVKSIVTFVPPLLVGLYLATRKKLWENFYR